MTKNWLDERIGHYPEEVTGIPPAVFDLITTTCGQRVAHALRASRVIDTFRDVPSVTREQFERMQNIGKKSGGIYKRVQEIVIAEIEQEASPPIMMPSDPVLIDTTETPHQRHTRLVEEYAGRLAAAMMSRSNLTPHDIRLARRMAADLARDVIAATEGGG